MVYADEICTGIASWIGNFLLDHPAIADATVMGISDDDGNEVPRTYVVERAGKEVSLNT